MVTVTYFGIIEQPTMDCVCCIINLHRFRDSLLQVFALMTPPLFHPNFWGVPELPVAPDRPRWGQCEEVP